MGLEENHACLAIFDVSGASKSLPFTSLLRKTTLTVLMCLLIALTSCNPNLSVNKPLKNEMKQRFQSRYAEEVRKEITNGTAIPDVKIDTRTSILKPKSANWLIGALAPFLKSLKLSSMVSERPALLMHLKLMDSRTLAACKVVSVLCIQKTLYTTVTLSIH